jgi:hypothetical protein
MEEVRKFQIKIFPELGFMTVKFFGYMGLKDMIQFTKEVTAHRDYSIEFPLICDFRASKAVAYRIDVGEFLKSYSSSVTIPKKKKYGLIYTTLNQKFLLSIFKLSGPFLNLEIELFNRPEDCIDWMTTDLDVKKKLEAYFNSQNLDEVLN